MSNKMHFDTKVIHAELNPDPSTGSVMPAIYPSTTFAQTQPANPIGDFEYTRTNNPTRDTLEKHLAALENAKYASCFSSGCAALTALLSTFDSGDHVILGDDVYGGTFRIFEHVFKKYGLEFSTVDTSNIQEIKQAITAKTKLVWIETPTNPTLKIANITETSKVCRASNVLLAVDNTFATPALQTPINLGANIVCHSTTKYIGGHSDVLGGVLITSDSDLNDKIKFIQNATGAVPSPFDCYLTLRSTKTLAIRMKQHCYNARKIAHYLETSGKINIVLYPGLETHPNHTVALEQMSDFGGMISCKLNATLEQTIKFMQNLKLFTLAESLGGVESLVEHPASMTHAAIPAEQRAKLGINDSLVRLSIGIENVDDLIEDIESSLKCI